ncbi:MAG: hypothetical protein AAFY10_10715 [Pseudomonadota bacterium]
MLGLLLTGCSPEGAGQAPVAEAPFFNVDRNGTGPLTMTELQVNIPAELDAMYTENMRTCLFTTIEDLAEKAGDPEVLDPSSVAFLPTDGSWEELTRFGKRSILAQAVISRAATLC